MISIKLFRLNIDINLKIFLKNIRIEIKKYILSFHRVTRWAEILGAELWELAEKVARPEELLNVSSIIIYS